MMKGSYLAVRFVRLTGPESNVRIAMEGSDLAVRFVRLTGMSGRHSAPESNECPNRDGRVRSCSRFCPSDWNVRQTFWPWVKWMSESRWKGPILQPILSVWLECPADILALSRMNVRIVMEGSDLAADFVRLTGMSGRHSGPELNECPNRDGRVRSCSRFCPSDWNVRQTFWPWVKWMSESRWKGPILQPILSVWLECPADILALSRMNVRIVMEGSDLAADFVRLTGMSGRHSGPELNECPNRDGRVRSCSRFCPPDQNVRRTFGHEPPNLSMFCSNESAVKKLG